MQAKTILLISMMCAWIIAPARSAPAGEVAELNQVRTEFEKVAQLIPAVDSVRKLRRVS